MPYRIYGSDLKLFNMIYMKFTKILNETDKGIKVEFADSETAGYAWLPKSLVAVNVERGYIGVPSTIATERNILQFRDDRAPKITQAALDEAVRLYDVNNLTEYPLIAERMTERRQNPKKIAEKIKKNAAKFVQYRTDKKRAVQKKNKTI